MNEPSNLVLSKNRTSSSPSISMVFSSCIHWNILTEQQVLFFSWQNAFFQRPKLCSRTNRSITSKNCETQKVFQVTPGTKNVLALILLKQQTISLSFFWKSERPQKKLFWNWNYQSHNIQDLSTINTKISKIRNKWAFAKSFLLIWQQGYFYNFGGNASNGWFEP